VWFRARGSRSQFSLAALLAALLAISGVLAILQPLGRDLLAPLACTLVLPAVSWALAAVLTCRPADE
jgi:hypothetical protein